MSMIRKPKGITGKKKEKDNKVLCSGEGDRVAMAGDGDHHQRPPPPPPRVVIFPSIGMGHMIPLAELAKQLVLRHGLAATFVTVPDPFMPPEALATFLDPLSGAGVDTVVLPPVDDLPNHPEIIVTLFLTISRSLPALGAVVRGLKQTARLVAFVTDPFGIDAFQVAKEAGVPPYIFFTSNLFLLSFSLHFPALHESTPEEDEFPELLRLPGCIPLRRRDIPVFQLQGRGSQSYKLLLRSLNNYDEAEGILVNTFHDLEPDTAAALKEVEPRRPSVYLVGPLIRRGQIGSESEHDASECLKWLDNQPAGSVLYISFGSLGSLTHAQTKEMAHGLEMSGHRFLWAVRTPLDKHDAAGDDPLSYLPEGFLERTKELGLVLPSWAPQVQILSHSSTGGFLTHCGWNSTLESIVNGVAMIAWPLHHEQRMNASLLVEGAKVAIRPEAVDDEGGVVGREEIARVVKEFMEGEAGRAVRRRVGELRRVAAGEMAGEGNSYKELGEVAAKWTGQQNRSVEDLS